MRRSLTQYLDSGRSGLLTIKEKCHSLREYLGLRIIPNTSTGSSTVLSPAHSLSDARFGSRPGSLADSASSPNPEPHCSCDPPQSQNDGPGPGLNSSFRDLYPEGPPPRQLDDDAMHCIICDEFRRPHTPRCEPRDPFDFGYLLELTAAELQRELASPDPDDLADDALREHASNHAISYEFEQRKASTNVENSRRIERDQIAREEWEREHPIQSRKIYTADLRWGEAPDSVLQGGLRRDSGRKTHATSPNVCEPGEQGGLREGDTIPPESTLLFDPELSDKIEAYKRKYPLSHNMPLLKGPGVIRKDPAP